MPKKKYLVTLTDDERTQLEDLLRGGHAATRKVTRARILLKAADNWQDARIAEALSVGRATVERTRQRFVEENLAALDETPTSRQHAEVGCQGRGSLDRRSVQQRTGGSTALDALLAGGARGATQASRFLFI